MDLAQVVVDPLKTRRLLLLTRGANNFVRMAEYHYGMTLPGGSRRAPSVILASGAERRDGVLSRWVGGRGLKRPSNLW